MTDLNRTELSREQREDWKWRAKVNIDRGYPNHEFLSAKNTLRVLDALDEAERNLANVQKMYDRACADIQDYSVGIERAKAEAEEVQREHMVMPPDALILADRVLAALAPVAEEGDEDAAKG